MFILLLSSPVYKAASNNLEIDKVEKGQGKYLNCVSKRAYLLANINTNLNTVLFILFLSSLVYKGASNNLEIDKVEKGQGKYLNLVS